MNSSSAIGGEILTLVVFLTIAVMQWYGKLPPIDKIVKLVEMLNTKGGNILILTGGTIVGAWATLRLMYFMLERTEIGKLATDNPLITVSISFISGTFTGGFLATLFKAMDGSATNKENKSAPPPPSPEVSS